MNDQPIYPTYRSTAMSPTIGELATALAAAQRELPAVLKDKTAKGEKFSYRYVGLDTVMPAALAVLSTHGLAIAQPVGHTPEGDTTLTTILMHKSGEWIADTQRLLLVKADPQGQGSAITYARRYGLMAMIGLVADDDDDAQEAMPRADASQEKPAARTPRAAPDRLTTEPKATEAEPESTSKRARFKEDAKCRLCLMGIPAGEWLMYDRDTKQIEHLAGQCPPMEYHLRAPDGTEPSKPGSYSTDAKITPPQIKAIRATIAELFGDDNEAAVMAVEAAMPAALTDGEIHLGGLTKAQGSILLDALTQVSATETEEAPPDA